jgi:hypothetical protein
MFTRDRRPKKRTVEMEPPPGAASTAGSGAAGTESLGGTGGTAGDRVRPMSSADRGRAKHKLAVQYSDDQATSALDPEMLEALVQGQGDSTRYNKRMNAPAPGGKTHYRVVVRQRCRSLAIALSDKQIDFLIQRKLSRVNFNLYERYTANLKLEAKQKTQKLQLPARGYTTLLRQFNWFQELFGLVVGPTEAAAIVGFWKRELDTMREEECVDWSTAYTLWRNMLVDYEIRWSEWDSQLYLPPTMWDWEDHTQKKYKKKRDLAILISDESEVTQWDTRPDVITEVSTSEAATADPEDTDTSAFVSRPLLLDTKVKTPKSTRKAKGRARARKLVVDTESEESEESSSCDSSDDDADPGRHCRRKGSGKVFKKCRDCPFFAKNKVCKFYHADAPVGTTGRREQLNKASDKKLVKLGVYRRKR